MKRTTYMKKNSIVWLLLIVIMISGCGKEKEKLSYNQRSAIMEKEDGWVYLYYCEFDKNKEESIVNPTYFFGGYNLKYKELDGYKVTIFNDKTGEVEAESTASLPALLYNKKYVKELDKINELLQEKKFSTEIKTDDLNVEIKEFKKEDIVQLHNKAMKDGNVKEGKFLALPEADIEQEKSVVDGYQWQVGYLDLYGNIKKVDIELIYSDGTYLSDKNKKEIATEDEKKVYNDLKSIEDKIVEGQKFDQVADMDTLTSTVDWKRLSKLLSTLDQQ